MRGADGYNESLFTTVRLESFVPAEHPLNHSVCSKNRDRLIEHDAVTELFNATVEMAEQRGPLPGEHFSVDGTLIQAWASHKSMRRKDGWTMAVRPKTGMASRAATPHRNPGDLSLGVR